MARISGQGELAAYENATLHFRNAMSRPPLFDRPMTAAERMRLYRSRKRDPQPPDRLVTAHGKTQKEFARKLGMSLRNFHYMQVFNRNRLIEWDALVIRGTYGKVGFAFLAEVCRLGDAGTQQLINDMIKERGAAYAKQIWRAAKADPTTDEELAAGSAASSGG
jgi:hypothetical protein